jgi:hypothetical protein
MSGWEDLKNDAGKIASKAAVKAGEITDAAASRIKLQGYKLRLCEEYEKLGRLVYKAHKNGADAFAGAADVLSEIDRLRSAIKKIEDETNARKEAHASANASSDDIKGDGFGAAEQV